MPGAGGGREGKPAPLLVGMKENNTVTLMALCCKEFQNLNISMLFNAGSGSDTYFVPEKGEQTFKPKPVCVASLQLSFALGRKPGPSPNVLPQVNGSDTGPATSQGVSLGTEKQGAQVV